MHDSRLSWLLYIFRGLGSVLETCIKLSYVNETQHSISNFGPSKLQLSRLSTRFHMYTQSH